MCASLSLNPIRFVFIIKVLALLRIYYHHHILYCIIAPLSTAKNFMHVHTWNTNLHSEHYGHQGEIIGDQTLHPVSSGDVNLLPKLFPLDFPTQRGHFCFMNFPPFVNFLKTFFFNHSVTARIVYQRLLKLISCVNEFMLIFTVLCEYDTLRRFYFKKKEISFTQFVF